MATSNTRNSNREPEQLEKGGVRIERTPWRYTVRGGELGGEYTRLHNVLELIGGKNIYMGSMKSIHASRINQLKLVERAFDMDEPIKLEPRSVSWSANVTALGGGMMLNDLLVGLKEQDANLRAKLNKNLDTITELCNEMGVPKDGDLVRAITGLVQTIAQGTPLEAVKAEAVARGIVTPGTSREDAIKPLVRDFMERDAYIDHSYMAIAGANGTAIHEVLETMANIAMEDNTVEWPETEIAERCKHIDPSFIEKARETWVATVNKFGIEPEHLFDTELVVLINHAGERIAGAVDLAIIQNDELIIMDWKTGTRADKPEYQAQLVSYSLASQLITRHGVIPIENPEAVAMVTPGAMDGEYDIPAKPEAHFSWEGRSVKLAPYGVLVRTAVDPTQDAEDQRPQFFQVSYDAELREFAYHMIQMHRIMEDRNITKRLQRGIRKMDERTAVRATTRATMSPTPERTNPTPAPASAPVVVVDQVVEEPFGAETPPVATPVQVDLPGEPAPIETVKAQEGSARDAKPQATAPRKPADDAQPTPPRPVNTPEGELSSNTLRVVPAYAQRYGWSENNTAQFIEALRSGDQKGSVAARAAAFNDKLRNTESMKV